MGNLKRGLGLSRWIRQAIIVLLFGAYAIVPFAFADDTIPPYLVDPIPAPGTVTSNWYVIRTGVLDDESGVNPDPDTVSVFINGAVQLASTNTSPSVTSAMCCQKSLLIHSELA